MNFKDKKLKEFDERFILPDINTIPIKQFLSQTIDEAMEQAGTVGRLGAIHFENMEAVPTIEQIKEQAKEQGRKELIAEMKSGKSVYYRGYLGENVIKNLTKN